jgi:hypothetical protein
MASAPDPMICPHCGAVMNRHAEKILYEMGRVEEVHACPSCAAVGSRPAAVQVDTAARARR